MTVCTRHQRRGQDANRAHHPAVLVLEQVAVIHECADRVGIAKIHAQPHARILERAAVEVRDVHGIAQERLVDRHARPVEQQKMQLMDVEGVQLGRAVLDDPVLDVALADHDVRLRARRDRTASASRRRRSDRSRWRCWDRRDSRASPRNRACARAPARRSPSQGSAGRRQRLVLARQARGGRPRIGRGDDRGQRAIRIVLAALTGVDGARDEQRGHARGRSRRR